MSWSSLRLTTCGFYTGSYSKMEISEFDYPLPEELIACEPAAERADARMALVRRDAGTIEHRVFRHLPEALSRSDLLVLNNTRVFPARLRARREPSGGEIEFLLLRELGEKTWEALARPARRAKPGTSVIFGNRLKAHIAAAGAEGRRVLAFEAEGDLWRAFEEIGEVPLPPYIKRPPRPEDKERYQTVYAAEVGSIAAPTAGLHFTEEVLNQMRARGIEIVEITLHIGYGTFQPLRAGKLEEQRLEPESYFIPAEAAEKIESARRQGRRIVAVGTTTTRALESAARGDGPVPAGAGTADSFIFPGHQFKVISGLLTNFHLPRSTPLLLVSAFAGRELTMRAYAEAIERRYRFYSYGDCMLIL